MKSKQIIFYSTGSDIEPVLKFIEASFLLQYFEMGMFDHKPETCFSSIFQIPNFGNTTFGDWNRDRRLIILPQNQSLIIREVPQKRGGLKYAIDQFANPISAGIQLGGIYKDGILLAGTFGIIAENEFSNTLFKVFSSTIRKEFIKIGSFYLGDEAKAKLQSGWRLVTNEKSPKEFDLTLG